MSKIDLVISFYKEDLSWLENYRHVKFNKIYLYNKGPNPSPDSKFQYIEIKLKNIGRCDHTYLYHIVNKYEGLADVTIFTTGSIGLSHKSKKLDFITNKTLQSNNSVFEGPYNKNVRDDFQTFQIAAYEATHPQNKDNTQPMALSKLRPFGLWYDSHFKGIDISLVNFGGIFSVARNHIHQHSKEYYTNLLREFPDNSNPEVGHYFERAWVAVFHPIPKECLYYTEDVVSFSFYYILLLILIFIIVLIYHKSLFKFLYKRVTSSS